MDATENPTPAPDPQPASLRWSRRTFILTVLVTAVVTFGVAALLTNIFQHKQEAKNPYLRFVDVNEITSNPEHWGKNWPRQYDGYLRTADVTHTKYGGVNGSEGAPVPSRLEADPWLKRMFAGYAFAIDFNVRRGHAYMLFDQEQTKRVLDKPQPGACIHCHASVPVTWRRLGLEAEGKSLSDVSVNDFAWPAVMEGFKRMSAMSYVDAHAELQRSPDGTSPTMSDPHASAKLPTTREALAAHAGGKAHPVSCIDCHDPKMMSLRVTRPGFVNGIRALATSNAPTPHIPSIERWRKTDRSAPYDPNVDASRQEMRAFVCGQCHVEYYCGPKETLFFPWANGLKVEEIEKTYDEHKFPDGTAFNDFKHAETGAEVIKAQHPEFELWSQGIHARSGVSCADCHMPYKREGAMKVSEHHVQSPLLMVNQSCQTCHRFPEEELKARVEAIQDRTHALMDRAGHAMTDMLDAIKSAKSAGATSEQLAPIYALQRKAQWRLDFINAENSMGFHAPQEAARILGESIDYSRQAQLAANGVARPSGSGQPPQESK